MSTNNRLVRDIMHPGVITCTPDTPIRKVAQELEQHRIHGLVVVDETGCVMGVITQTDLVRARSIKPNWGSWEDLPCGRMMTPYPVMVRPSDSVQLAIGLLNENHIHRLIVVQDEASGQCRPIGILSMTDLVREMAQQDHLPPQEAR